MAIENLKYVGLKLVAPKIREITDEEINAELERFRTSQAEVTEDENPERELKNGDTAHIDFTGYLNGEKFEGGEAKCFDLKIGSHQFVPGFEEGMLGMKPGEERDVKLTFPKEYVPELAGKEVVFKVLLHAIKDKKEVELTDELVKKVTKMESVEEFKNAYRMHLTEERAQEYMAMRNDLILNEISKNATVEIPAESIDNQVNEMYKRLENDLSRYGMTPEQYFEMNGTNKENELKRVREIVKENMKKVLILEEIAEKENLYATDEEVEKYLEHAPKENVDKQGVKTSLTYAKTLQYLDSKTEWEEK